ncbi:MAG: sulfur carrier protein ThiS [Deltaproteobacteria bacterium]|nr:sulfur carrier protein ThiS [Deltaproteobacteria bacterium]MBW2300499.1 sulfur carrier protein ThiS [Deltaproteobacteria bacterium]
MIKVGKKIIPWREGMSVADLLNDLKDPYAYPVVKVNGKLVSRIDFEKTLIPDNSEVYLIPMVAGG